ncbi:translation initiation factor IF-2 N-terminal domain-containing protein [Kibdelosporangium phytohabitans]|uniref:Ribonuclease E n=1 Tax=Kibdelosporangium phytohabitans TaxID=860235 RepID=A0A0N9HWK1_9PSEU|nr:translation initiation factor IF-2 N-terminal domain-containing protein [Kibdelosporangium phytohabitans]ALG07485.1 ribonuclease E [Kibdelosporangium phytohabitans]MBE1471602.1 ribonuclease E [Kibdelosporangium phytohabitans]
MSDTTAPAGEGSTERDLIDLPPKIRVHALAKLLGASSREVMAALADMDQEVRSAQSSVSREVAQRVVDALAPQAEAQEEPVPQVADSSTPEEPVAEQPADEPAEPAEPEAVGTKRPRQPLFASASPLFLPPEAQARTVAKPEPVEEPAEAVEEADDAEADDGSDEDSSTRRRRRRGRRGRGRGKGGQNDEAGDEQDDDEAPEAPADEPEAADASDDDGEDAADDGSNRRRRRRRRRKGSDGDDPAAGEDDPPNTVVHVREARDEKPKADKPDRDEVRSVRGSTRLEAKRQRRRDGREAGRRRAPILSEAEFLTRRESVDRKMIVRERADRTQIGVLEDGVLVEHFVTASGSGSLVGNVYLGRVQNVLPSMEAAFVDIGRGRNAVLYAGEVDWDAAGLEGKARRIEQALSTGDSVLVQVTKDPVGHKGARLTTQISLPGRFLVYVPGGGATGISRKLPENERRRLKDILKRIVPEDAGVIIRTASEGISEDELARDVRRLQAQWQVIKDKAHGSDEVKKASAPTLLYEEPDLLVKVVRDLFTEDFSALVVQGDDAWDTIDAYVRHVAPDLQERLQRHVGPSEVFTEFRIDEQLLKALDRKVWLPSGGYLVIDRTEAMTVIDVNTGKFTGSGGNLEETVTRNNLESAEEIVRQLRLRDIGGIIVIDFIDMVLESNRDLVLRRLTECLGRDRTRHQVAEVTSLGLVQMTRKRVGTGLLEAFSSTCEHCRGRGVVVSTEPIIKTNGGGGNGGGGGGGQQHQNQPAKSGKAEDKPAERTRERPTRAERRAKAERARAEAAEAAEAAESAETHAEAAAEVAADAAADAVAAAAQAAADADQVAAEVEAAPEPDTVEVAVEDPVEPEQAEETAPQPRSGTAEHAPGTNGHVTAPAAPAQPDVTPDSSEVPQGVDDELVLAPPPRRQRRRSASRPAGPPVNAAPEH